MSPIYNPTAGGGGLNVYESSLAYLNGYDFFSSIGILDNTFTEVMAATTTIPPFDSEFGTVSTIDNSVSLAGAGVAVSWAGWNIPVQEEVLMVSWMNPGLSAMVGLGLGETTLPVGALQDDFQIIFQTAQMLFGKHVGGVFTTLATDNTIQNTNPSAQSAKGLAIYANGATNQQQLFINYGGFWFHILTTNDAAFSTYESVFLRHYGNNARFITPIYVWGK